MIRPPHEINDDGAHLGQALPGLQQALPSTIGSIRIRRLFQQHADKVDFDGVLPGQTDNLCVSLRRASSTKTWFDGRLAISPGGPIGSFAIPSGARVSGNHCGTVDFIEFRIPAGELPVLLDKHDLRPRSGGVRAEFVAADGLLERRQHQLRFALDSAPRLDVLYLDTMLEACLSQLLRRHVEVSAAASRRPSLTPAALRRIADYIEAHIDQPLRLEQLAKVVGISRAHFARAFHNETGVTPHRYVMQRRVEAALIMLKTGDLPLSDIASMTGFADNAHLNRMFRKLLGVRPSEARGMVRKVAGHG